MNHYLTRSMKCLICSSNFNLDSRILELNIDEAYSKIKTSSNRLIHSECAKCKVCCSNIKGLDEYSIQKSDDQSINLICKCCLTKSLSLSHVLSEAKNKKVFNSNIRLSSRQKELLASKILTEKIEFKKILTEASEIVKYLSNEIKCSKKSLVFYLNKHIKKANEKESLIEAHSSLESQEGTSWPPKNVIFNDLKKNPLRLMLDELNKLDKILAPNKFPFGQLDKPKNTEQF